jgi:hypothetical protein
VECLLCKVRARWLLGCWAVISVAWPGFHWVCLVAMRVRTCVGNHNCVDMQTAGWAWGKGPAEAEW